MQDTTLVERAIGGLVDTRLPEVERISNLSAATRRYIKGALGPIGDQLWEMVNKYYSELGSLMTLEEMKASLVKLPGDDQETASYLLEKIRQGSVTTPSQFKYAWDMLSDSQKNRMFLVSIGNCIEILTKGVPRKGKTIRGFKAAYKYMTGVVEKLSVGGKSTSFTDLRREGQSLVEESTHLNVKTGFSCIDDSTGGMQPGELWLVAGYAGEGKSLSLVNMAWNAVVLERKSVLIYSGEMSAAQYFRRLVTRHSHHTKFSGGPLRYEDIKRNTLTDEEKVLLEKVVEDFKSCEDYGQVSIHPIGGDDHILSIRRDVELMGSNRPDVIMIDYLALVPATQRRVNRREELSETIRAAKMLAQDCFKGEGIVVVAAYQTNRQGRDRAAEEGFYSLKALEETAEAEKSPDVIMWLLRTPELEETNEMKVGLMKVRDGAKLAEAFLYADFTTCLLGNLRED